ncbi:unnamed protein product [Scytosiphon promiscuus]
MDGAISEDDFSLGPEAAATDQHDGGDAGENHDVELAIRAALNFSIGEVCSAENGKLAMTGSAVSTLAELVFKYTEALALDLRVFAKHGKRAVVGVDDVKCAARKDPKLVEKLATFEAARTLSAGKSKKTTARKKKTSKSQNQNQNQNQRRDGAGARGEGEGEGGQEDSANAIGAAAPAVLKKSVNANPGSSGGRCDGDNFVDLLDEQDGDKQGGAEEEEEVFQGTSLGARGGTKGHGLGGAGSGDVGGEGGGRNRNGGGRYESDGNESEDDDLLL